MNTTLEHKSQTANQRAQQHENQSAKAYPSRTIVHAKLEMTEPGDHDEREADAMASAIMSGGKISRKISSGASGSSGIAVSQQMESQLAHLQGGGRQMPEGLRNMMETGFGRDFSQVRLHTDGEAANMSSSIHAKAFTHGNDIYFNRGQFSPETSEGQHLVAHELTHVVQGTGKIGRNFSDIIKSILDAEEYLRLYVKQLDWVKSTALGETHYGQLLINYIPEELKMPIILVLYTCKEKANGAFEEQGNGPICSLLDNPGNNRILMIQVDADTKREELINMVYNLKSQYGLIKHFIFRGHGNKEIMTLNDHIKIKSSNGRISQDDQTLFNSILESKAECTNNPQKSDANPTSIMLDGCLTDSVDGGLSDAVREHYSGMNVMVTGNEASVWTDEQRITTTSDGTPHLSNVALTEKEAPKVDFNDSGNYKGCEPIGILRNMIRRLDKGTLNETTYCDGNDNNFKIVERTRIRKKDPRSGNYYYKQIDYRPLIAYVKRSLAAIKGGQNVNNNEPSTESELIEFLIFIDNNIDNNPYIFLTRKPDSTITKRGSTYPLVIFEFDINQSIQLYNNSTQGVSH